MNGVPVSEKSAWMKRGYEDERKGWPARKDVPERWQGAYLSGRRRARNAERVEG